MASRNILTAARLREMLSYNPASGNFSWVKKTKNRWRETVGSRTKDQHPIINICVDYRTYKAHRLAWLWMTGEWPTSEIDHINRNSTDNRWSNLRLSDRSQNMRNHGGYRTNTSGTTGVVWDKTGKRWIVRVAGKHIGSFHCKEEATRIALLLRKDW